ncbi:glutamine--fructose-6-phosphate aminotransferase, partial [Klebsiella variicola]|nr:glutamine--fructose-6-phosphate aminotransferase [Klebsiella variicola]
AEIGVASTKAFTTQLAGLLMLVAALGRYNSMAEGVEARIAHALSTLPNHLEHALKITEEIEALAEEFADKEHSLFLGRGE